MTKRITTICYNCGDQQRLHEDLITKAIGKGIGKCKQCNRKAVAISGA